MPGMELVLEYLETGGQHDILATVKDSVSVGTACRQHTALTFSEGTPGPGNWLKRNINVF